MTTPAHRFRGNQWVPNDASEAQHWIFTALGMGGTSLVMVAFYSMQDDFVEFLSQLRKVVDRSTTKPNSAKPFYEQNANNQAAKLTDMLLLHSLMVNVMSHFMIDDDAIAGCV